MPNLRGYVCDLFQTPGVAASVNLDHIKVGGRGGRATDGRLPCVPLEDACAICSFFFSSQN